jgi:hypothetical protein
VEITDHTLGDMRKDFADGKITDVDDLPTLTEIDNFLNVAPKSPKGILYRMDNHHVVEKRIQTRLRLAETDEVPGILLWGKGKDVARPNGEAWHRWRDIQENPGLVMRIKSEVLDASDDDQELLENLRDLYTSSEYVELEMWPIARAWLLKKGVNPQSIPD